MLGALCRASADPLGAAGREYIVALAAARRQVYARRHPDAAVKYAAAGARTNRGLPPVLPLPLVANDSALSLRYLGSSRSAHAAGYNPAAAAPRFELGRLHLQV